MPSVTQKHPNEHFEALLRRFKKAVDNAGTIQELRSREAFEKPTTKRKRAKAAAKKRWAKKLETLVPLPRTNQR